MNWTPYAVEVTQTKNRTVTIFVDATSEKQAEDDAVELLGDVGEDWEESDWEDDGATTKPRFPGKGDRVWSGGPHGQWREVKLG